LVDVFDEVEEQLRSDRYRTLARSWAPWAGGVALVVVLAVGGYWGWSTWQDSLAAKASDGFAAGVEALQAGDEAKAFSSFEQVAKTGNPAFKSMALMAQGGMRLQAGEAGDAAGFFDRAADADKDPLFSDQARLKSALALMDTAPYAQTEAKLMPLMGDKRPYRLQAKEALAFARLMAGNVKDARRDFVALQTMLGVSESMRQRANLALQTIDSGSAKTLPAIVKQSLATPPSPPQPQFSPDMGPPQQ
jgi:hypothetical protein